MIGMTPQQIALAALDSEFSADGSTMMPAEFERRRAELLAQPAALPVLASESDAPVSEKRLHARLLHAGQLMVNILGKRFFTMTNALTDRVAKLEAGTGQDRIEELATRLSSCESRLGPAIMLLASIKESSTSAPAGHDNAAVVELESRCAKAEAMLASLEKRASRQGDHLANLETKIQAMRR